MRSKTLILASLFIFSLAAALKAQKGNPYKDIGKKGEILTLTKGEFEEFFDEEDIQQIGTNLVNIRTMKVVKVLTDEEAEKRLDNTVGNRFLSVDPIASKYPMLTPYQYASNTPIQAVDLDGKEGIINTIKFNGKPVLEVITIKVLIAVTNNPAKASSNTTLARPFDVGNSYQNEQALGTEMLGILNSVYNQNKQMSDVMTNPNTVNGNVPVYYNFEVETFRVENMSIGDKKREMQNSPNYTFPDYKSLYPNDAQEFSNFQIVGQNNLTGAVGDTKSYESTIDLNHFNLRNSSSQVYKDFSNTFAHEIGHKLLMRHPDPEKRNPGKSEYRHNMPLGGIFRYSIQLGANPTIILLPPSKTVTQPNTKAFVEGSLRQKDINIPAVQ
ncbi:MAG: hypothetical protein KF862_17175 [Chitinophagaceae bacterium]|nr:hypothetical protein [Chitinophagaceae bacterium]